MPRMNEVIVSGGFNILAIDIENALLEHPDISAAAVIGGGSEQRGEVPVAFVEVWGPVGFNTETAKTWVNARLSPQEQIYEIRVIEQLPRSPLGEVLKRELRERFT